MRYRRHTGVVRTDDVVGPVVTDKDRFVRARTDAFERDEKYFWVGFGDTDVLGNHHSVEVMCDV